MPDQASHSPLHLTEQQLDALREVANIGCGHAANALSQLVGGRTVGVEVPRALVAGYREVTQMIGGSEMPMVGVAAGVCGWIQGRMLILMSEHAARSLAGAMLGRPLAPGALSEEARSALCEAGNILGSACLNAIAGTLRARLLPSIPSFSHAPAGTVLLESVTSLSGEGARALVLETRFRAAGEPSVAGHFLIVPDEASVPVLLAALER